MLAWWIEWGGGVALCLEGPAAELSERVPGHEWHSFDEALPFVGFSELPGLILELDATAVECERHRFTVVTDVELCSRAWRFCLLGIGQFT